MKYIIRKHFITHEYQTLITTWYIRFHYWHLFITVRNKSLIYSDGLQQLLEITSYTLFDMELIWNGCCPCMLLRSYKHFICTFGGRFGLCFLMLRRCASIKSFPRRFTVYASRGRYYWELQFLTFFFCFSTQCNDSSSDVPAKILWSCSY